MSESQSTMDSANSVTEREPADPDGIADVFNRKLIASDIWEVESWSGSEYTVDMRNPACTCPDFEYRERVCKHIISCKVEELRKSVEGREA
jgi:hypothetical protein